MQFTDFHEFAHSVRDVVCEMTPFNVRRPNWSFAHVDLGQTHLQIGDEGSGTIAEGICGRNGSIVFVPLTEGIRYAVSGQEIGHHSVAVLGPGSEFCVASQDPHVWAAIFVPMQPGSQAERQRATIARAQAIDLGPESVSHLRGLVKAIGKVAADVPKFDFTPAAQTAGDDLLAAAKPFADSLLGTSGTASSQPRLPQWEIIHRCRSYLEARQHLPVSIGVLTAAANTSERSLRNAFSDVYGVSPKRYLLLRQLAQVRRALLSADSDDASVTQILAAQGVWQFGRFAERYRRQYGENPSETLRGVCQ